MKKLTISDFASSFDTSEDTFSSKCKAIINDNNFYYKELESEELDNLYLVILKQIELDKQKIGAKKRTKVWQNGWAENLEEFINSGYDEETLVPKFIRRNQPVRLNQNYVFPKSSEFELDFVKVYRHWFLENYFKDVDNIYEFGCGTGFNLLTASEIFPNKSLYGSDFVQSSVDLVNTISESKSIQLSGSLFDMLNPNYDYKIKNNSGV
ncbi:MAG: class I SAM-dependent methyltransferase, partial [SAR202 cluster bacterium]|nr:class I SAM-dependent methyltransferase [SAR202 cluster bacterium]